MLRVATAGSVDDGKSTLIGRLLYDSKSIFEDQLRAIEHASMRRGSKQIELSLLTDGLRAEREQNITIDVAYRYFSTKKRKFIIADTPGHIQYTRNMVTGTSTADLSLILVDARKGILSQSKRHAAISALLGVRHVVLAVNKMDLVGFSEQRFNEIVCDFQEVTNKLEISEVHSCPVSALLGGNVVERSIHMDWYSGPTLLGFLEQVPVIARDQQTNLRLPIQCVIRSDQDFRGVAGQIESGYLKVGQSVTVLPSEIQTKISSLMVGGQICEIAQVGDPVVVTLVEDIDLTRGDMIVVSGGPPVLATQIEAVICWMDDEPMNLKTSYLMLHTTRQVQAQIVQVSARIDIDTLELHPSNKLETNDIGEVTIQLAKPIFADKFRDLPETGSFVLVAPGSNRTVAAGMIRHCHSNVTVSQEQPQFIVWIDISQPVEPISELFASFERKPILLEENSVNPIFRAHVENNDVTNPILVLAELLHSQGQDVIIHARHDLAQGMSLKREVLMIGTAEADFDALRQSLSPSESPSDY